MRIDCYGVVSVWPKIATGPRIVAANEPTLDARGSELKGSENQWEQAGRKQLSATDDRRLIRDVIVQPLAEFRIEALERLAIALDGTDFAPTRFVVEIDQALAQRTVENQRHDQDWRTAFLVVV